YNGSKQLFLRVENFDDYTVDALDAYVTVACVESDYNTDIMLPGGVDNSMDMDEAKETLEENDIDYKKDNVTYYFTDYLIDSGDYTATLEYITDTDELSSIQLYVDIKDTENYQGVGKTDVETMDSDDVDIDYDEPDEISKITDFELDGVLYSIGAPVSAFIENGWELDEDNSSTDRQVEAHDIGFAVLKKGESQMQLSVENNESDTVDIKDTVTKEVVVRDTDDFMLWGDIESGDKLNKIKDDIESLGYEYEESSSGIMFYDEDNIWLNVLLRDGKATGFSLG
nr:hypothetical protein [Lachnospiraceae bacterium]